MSETTFVPASLLCDAYKICHFQQYPSGTRTVYSTWTPRTSRIPGIDAVVAFGIQGFVLETVVNYFNQHFFSRPVEVVVAEYERYVRCCLGVNAPVTSHIAALHKVGYLPVRIKCVPEGTMVPIRCPMATIENTLPEFFWVTNYLETIMSCSIWLPTTSATMAYQFKKLLLKYARETDPTNVGFVQFQGHDFSMRGMGNLGAAMSSGAGHLTSFVGSDTIPAISYLEAYYGANIENELVGCSVPATEHSVEEACGQDEYAAIRRLITEVYPTGIVSRVSDTWNLWQVITKVLPMLKPQIMGREGKLVIRPDSGDPVKIICGDPEAKVGSPEHLGVIRLLWDIFEGAVNSQGYRVLDPHIGAIYGDAITLERCKQICEGLKSHGFASTNVVFGIGSFTYQYVTRDTFGFALKTTYAQIDGEEKMLFKDPITDPGSIKKSQLGKVIVLQGDKGLHYLDGLDNAEVELYAANDILKEVYCDGKVTTTTLAEIRQRIAATL